METFSKTKKQLRKLVVPEDLGLFIGNLFQGYDQINISYEEAIFIFPQILEKTVFCNMSYKKALANCTDDFLRNYNYKFLRDNLSLNLSKMHNIIEHFRNFISSQINSPATYDIAFKCYYAVIYSIFTKLLANIAVIRNELLSKDIENELTPTVIYTIVSHLAASIICIALNESREEGSHQAFYNALDEMCNEGFITNLFISKAHK